MQNQVVIIPKSKGGYITSTILQLSSDKKNKRGFICEVNENRMSITLLESNISNSIDLLNPSYNVDFLNSYLDGLPNNINDYCLYFLDFEICKYYPSYDEKFYEASNIFCKGNNSSLLILLIEEDKLEEKINEYKNISVLVLQEKKFQSLISFSSVILCGGRSTRMKKDKAFIDYHGLPQYIHQSKMLAVLFPTTFISEKEDKKSYEVGTNVIFDNLNVNGPINGLYSAMTKLNSNIFLLGVDYPYVTYIDILKLFNEHENDTNIVCYFHTDEDVAEPLVSLYFKSISGDLEKYVWTNENPSIQKFIREQKVTKIPLTLNSNIISVDQ